MTLQEFNSQDKSEAERLLLTCCSSAKWASLVMIHSTFKSEEELVDIATVAWYDECAKEDWLEAFTHHPKIGDVKSLEEKIASTKHLAGTEQSGVNTASQTIIEALAKANKDYEAKFGFIFIVCATGKTAEEMLRLLEDRLKNNQEDELRIAMGEQHKITIIRFNKILNKADWLSLKVSQLTTHVLDTSIGKPAQEITIKLKEEVAEDTWQTVTQGVTNSDGRIADLLPPNRILNKGNYKLVFDTAFYFTSTNTKGFYPSVEIQFTISDEQHYHVPLLITPFGYSTYRGS